VRPAVYEEASRRGVEVVEVPTAEAIRLLARSDPSTNAALHITC
jgi:hypothetical protein